MWGAAALWAGVRSLGRGQELVAGAQGQSVLCPCDGTADYLYGVVEVPDEILDDGQLLEVLLPEVCL